MRARLFDFAKRLGAALWRFARRRPFVTGFVLLLALLILPPLLKPKVVPIFEYVKVERGLVERTVTASGRLQPQELVMVGSEVSGLVLAVDVEVGDQVHAGQRLAQIEDAVLASDWKASQSGLKSAEANLASAQNALQDSARDLARYAALLAQGYTTQRDYEQVRQRAEQARANYQVEKSNLANARANEQRVRINYSRARIITPINGTVIERYINKGQTLASNFQIPTLFQVASDLRKMKLEVYIDEVDMAAIKTGQVARFTVDTFPDDHFTGTVTQISNAPSDINGVTAYKVTAELDNPDNKLRPGMSATVVIVTHSFANVLRLPVKAENFGKSYDPLKAQMESASWGISIVTVEAQSQSRSDGQAVAGVDKAYQVPGEKIEKIKLWRETGEKGLLRSIEVSRWFTGDDYIAILPDLTEGARVAVAEK